MRRLLLPPRPWSLARLPKPAVREAAGGGPHRSLSNTPPQDGRTPPPCLFSSSLRIPPRLPHPPGLATSYLSIYYRGLLPNLLPPRRATPPPLPPLPSRGRLGRVENHRLASLLQSESRDPRGGKPVRMPAQKRRLPSPSPKPRDDVADTSSDAAAGGGAGEGRFGRPPLPSRGPSAAKRRLTDPAESQPHHGREDDSDAEDDGGADSDSELSQSDGGGGTDEFMLVKLAEIRKEVQCPICLGIIRKTRTVMECLHRFCRDCIDKSMRLGNNECPACRTHCASRRSLRDDPKYDALIAALYPDIDKYEEEELAFNEQERIRNQKIQENIEETFRRQSEAMGKKRSAAKATATVLSRKYRRNMRARGRGRTITPDIAPAVSDEEDREEENANEVTKAPSSADDRSPDLRHKRCRKTSASPARTIGSSDCSFEENDELVGGKEFLATSPLRGEMLAWGKNGTRSQNRHGSTGSNGRIGRSGRIAKLVDHLRNTDEMDKEFQLYLVLLPVDGQAIPNLEKPYISCRPTLSIQHLVQLIALQLSRKVEELEMYIRMDHHHGRASSTGEFDGLERLREDKLLSDLHPSFASSNGDLELRYALKTRD